MVNILDTTLREGEQTKGVIFTKQQKIKIAKLLDDLGVDKIEAGHPIISKRDFECVKAVANLKLKAEILGHARARKEDIDAVADSGCKWVGIFCGVNEISRENKLGGISKEEVYNKIIESIKYSKKLGLNVRYSIEDSTRTELKDIIEITRLAIKSGADVISIVDTTGCATPNEFYKIIKTIKEETSAKLEVHCHNDYGLALANSLAAYEAGVDTIDVSINGIGERAGITSLAELFVNLNMKYGESGRDLSRISYLKDKVEEYSKVKMDKLRPIVGKNAFTHVADLHVKAVKKNPHAYESLDPVLVGRNRELIFKK